MWFPTMWHFDKCRTRKEHLKISVISAMCAASQLPGMGPTDVDDAPAPAR